MLTLRVTEPYVREQRIAARQSQAGVTRLAPLVIGKEHPICSA
jgi:hypothetical protein